MTAPPSSRPGSDGPSLERLYSINLDGSRNHLHPADVRGRFITWRRVVFAFLMLIYLVLPLVKIGGHPTVQLDIAGRRFYLFGSIFNSQDVWMMLFIFTGVAFSLLFFTAWLGRVWCGWACPQTVFLEGIYRPIERFFEGSREARIKLQKAPWTPGKVARKVGKHAAFVAISLFIAHVTLSLFVSGRELIDMMQHNPRAHWEAFLWMLAITIGFYFNFAWFREQLCIVVCPYGRLQSALTDRDSMIIGYDDKRGEPRGKAGPTREEGAGDCVDCKRCIVVCPTGIDIRGGLQMECIGCTQCIDACDEIMDKLDRPRGLIRYDSQNGLEGKARRTLRPRLYAYLALLLIPVAGLSASLATRTPFEANLIRARGAPYILEGTTIRNQFELNLINKNNVATTFHLEPGAPIKAAFILPQNDVVLAPLEGRRLPLFVTVESADFKGSVDITVTITESPGTAQKQSRARLLGPTAR